MCNTFRKSSNMVEWVSSKQFWNKEKLINSAYYLMHVDMLCPLNCIISDVFKHVFHPYKLKVRHDEKGNTA